jgi:Flp pilus assembly protein TadG
LSGRIGLGSDQRGLIGRFLIVVLLLIVLGALAVAEGGAILLGRFRVDDIAEAAATEGASVLARTGSSERARQAALDEVHRIDPEARLTSFRFGPQGEVRVTVRKQASTFLVDRIGFLEHLGVVRAFATSGPPEP